MKNRAVLYSKLQSDPSFQNEHERTNRRENPSNIEKFKYQNIQTEGVNCLRSVGTSIFTYEGSGQKQARGTNGFSCSRSQWVRIQRTLSFLRIRLHDDLAAKRRTRGLGWASCPLFCDYGSLTYSSFWSASRSICSLSHFKNGVRPFLRFRIANSRL